MERPSEKRMPQATGVTLGPSRVLNDIQSRDSEFWLGVLLFGDRHKTRIAMKCKERNLKVEFYLQHNFDEWQKRCLGFHFREDGEGGRLNCELESIKVFQMVLIEMEGPWWT